MFQARGFALISGPHSNFILLEKATRLGNRRRRGLNTCSTTTRKIIRMWLRDKGGVEKMTIEEFWVLDAEKLWDMGYRKCNPDEIPIPMTVKKSALEQYRP